MFRILACLAISMTAGTLLLSYLEPAAGGPAPSLTPQQYLRKAKAAVNTWRAPPRSWHGVTIIPIRQPADRSTLTAIAPQHDVHFVVESTGRVVACRPWRQQRPLGGSRRIHVGLSTPGAEGPLSRAQLHSLPTLLEALSIAVSEPGTRAPLAVDVDERTCKPRLARTIRSLLHARTGRS